MFVAVVVILGIAAAYGLGLAWVRLGVRRYHRLIAQERAADAALLHHAVSLGRDFRSARLVFRQADLPVQGGMAAIDWEDRLIARDRTTSQLIALVPWQPSSEEETAGTAVFVWQNGSWRTKGQTLNGVSPEEAYHRHAKRLSRAA